MSTKKTTAKKIAAKKSPAKKTAPKKTALKKTAPKKTAPRKARPAAGADNYTDPALRDRLKDQIMAADKGGRPGQWSARKAQLLAHEYTAQGGSYKHPRDESQQYLKDWGDEHWHTADGKPAIQGEETHRYLPDEAWKQLTPAQKKATDQKKVAGSQEGRQFVPNTKPAGRARKLSTKHTG